MIKKKNIKKKINKKSFFKREYHEIKVNGLELKFSFLSSKHEPYCSYSYLRNFIASYIRVKYNVRLKMIDTYNIDRILKKFQNSDNINLIKKDIIYTVFDECVRSKLYVASRMFFGVKNTFNIVIENSI